MTLPNLHFQKTMLLIQGFFIFLLHLTVGRNLESQANVCSTPGCKKAAELIYSSMNKSADPCVDFYQYACGNFLKNTPIPKDKGSYGTYSVAMDNLEIRIRDVIENNKDMTYKPFALVSNYYKSCMNTAANDRQGSRPLLNKLNQLIGGWPLILGNKWNERRCNLMNSLINLNWYGYKYIFNFGISVDYMDSAWKIPIIFQPRFGINREFLVRENLAEQRNDYRNLAIAIVKAVSGSEPAQWQINDIDDVINFEIKLANASIPDKDRVDQFKLFVKQTYKDVQNKLRNVFNFKYFTDQLLKRYQVIADSEQIVQADTPYFRALGDILKQTPRRVIANYLGLRFALDTYTYLSPTLFKEANKIGLKMNGIAREPERWKTCSIETRDKLEQAVGKLYVNKYFTEETKKEVLEIVAVIDNTLQSIIKDIDWMDAPTKQRALKKLDAVTLNVAYPDFYDDPSALIKEYQRLCLTPESYFNNILNIGSFNAIKLFRERKLPVDKEKWPMSPALFNAFYNPLNNSIFLLVGFLQTPVYDSDVPRSVNYGRIGSFVGHEFTHGFDSTGRSFDEHGNLLNWWTDSSLEKFKEKVQCFIDQYEQFYMPEVDLHVNGIYTATENVADAGGVREGYKAFLDSLKTSDDPILPGSDFNNEQLFFLSYATLWCSAITNEALRNIVLSDSHSPSKFRVNGPLSNMPEFQKAFNCPKSSPMVHDPPCRVW